MLWHQLHGIKLWSLLPLLFHIWQFLLLSLLLTVPQRPYSSHFPTLYLLSSKTGPTSCKNSLSYPHPLPKSIFGSSANHFYYIVLILFIIYFSLLFTGFVYGFKEHRQRHIPFFWFQRTISFHEHGLTLWCFSHLWFAYFGKYCILDVILENDIIFLILNYHDISFSSQLVEWITAL